MLYGFAFSTIPLRNICKFCNFFLQREVGLTIHNISLKRGGLLHVVDQAKALHYISLRRNGNALQADGITKAILNRQHISVIDTLIVFFNITWPFPNVWKQTHGVMLKTVWLFPRLTSSIYGMGSQHS